MARKKQSRGACAFCGKDYTAGGMSKHLAACAERKQAVEKADASRRKSQPLYSLRVRDAYDGSSYWLHLEMSGTARLEDLDHYLRAIWLECCGHLSEFEIGGQAFRGEELDMESTAARTFDDHDVLIHIYDFGTSSETRVEAAGVREGRPLSKHPIFLMARNHPPVHPCVECGEPAEFLCMECIVEHDESGFLCAKHAKTHPHDDYGEPVGVYNSPRTGMCGYDGPAEPPY